MTQTKRHIPGPPGWGLDLRLTTLSRKKLTVQEPVLKPRKDGTTNDGHGRKRTNEIRIATWNLRTIYKRVMREKIHTWRKRGRPKVRWLDDVQEDRIAQEPKTIAPGDDDDDDDDDKESFTLRMILG